MIRNIAILALSIGMLVAMGCEQQTTTQAPSSEPATAELEAAPVAAQAIETTQVEIAGEPLCTLQGAAGSVIDCQLKLAADANGIPARALQATLSFDATQADFVGFFGQLCLPNQDCMEKQITAESATIGSTGHMMRHSPADKIANTGRVIFIVANISNPTAAISEAGIDAAETFITARFSLKDEVRGDSPLIVSMGNVVASDEAARELGVRVADATIITGAAVAR